VRALASLVTVRRPLQHPGTTRSHVALVVVLAGITVVAVVAGGLIRLDGVVEAGRGLGARAELPVVSLATVADLVGVPDVVPPAARDLVVPMSSSLLVLVVWLVLATSTHRHEDRRRRRVRDGGPGRRGPPSRPVRPLLATCA